ncbi:hypothetical protein ACFE04_008651 [Oxalis oulophora]
MLNVLRRTRKVEDHAGAAAKGAPAVTQRPKPVPIAPAPPATPAPQVMVVYSRKDVENQLPLDVVQGASLATTQKDIVNPVPQTEKTEQMFNKMTNHAAYSAKNGETKSIVETKIEVSANVASKL